MEMTVNLTITGTQAFALGASGLGGLVMRDMVEKGEGLASLTIITEWPLAPHVAGALAEFCRMSELDGPAELDPDSVTGIANPSIWYFTAADVIDAVGAGELVFNQPEPIDSWPAYVSAYQRYQEKEIEAKTTLFARHGDALENLRQQINSREVPEGQSLHARWSGITGVFYIEASGPAELLNMIAGMVRAAGFWWDRSSLKDEPREYVSLALYGPVAVGETAINVGFLNFSSTTCRRVKTGTKFEEVAVYEIQCSE